MPTGRVLDTKVGVTRSRHGTSELSSMMNCVAAAQYLDQNIQCIEYEYKDSLDLHLTQKYCDG